MQGGRNILELPPITPKKKLKNDGQEGGKKKRKLNYKNRNRKERGKKGKHFILHRNAHQKKKLLVQKINKNKCKKKRKSQPQKPRKRKKGNNPYQHRAHSDSYHTQYNTHNKE